MERFSSELELNLDNIEAKDLLEKNDQLLPEVNTRDIVELNVSMCKSLSELNDKTVTAIDRVIDEAKDLGGRVYGGGSLLSSIADVEPTWYRTTALSETCARGLLNMTSQQLVVGMADEKEAWTLYNRMRNIGPVCLALSAASPYHFDPNFKDSGLESVRIQGYETAMNKFPEKMWKEQPEIHSLDEYHARLQDISDTVKEQLAKGDLDANWKELLDEEKGPHVPFDCLNDSQIYWMLRPRPSHETISSGGNCVMSLEFRAPDMGVRKSDVLNMNRFLVGVAQYALENDLDELQTDSVWEEFRNATTGLDTKLFGQDARTIVSDLGSKAVRGLCERGEQEDAEMLKDYLVRRVFKGAPASDIRQRVYDRGSAITYLSEALSENSHTRLRFGYGLR